jgi:hypothetical protein
MKKDDLDLDSLYQDLAGRFRALSVLFSQLGSQDAVQQLLESLISGDADAFARLIEPVEIPNIPPLGKCFWLREIVERVAVTPTLVEVCRLRQDLTPAERWLFIQIARRYGALILLVDPRLANLGEGPEIPLGPFLDELRANGLVTCKPEVKYDVSTTPVLGKPERVCV